MLKTQFGTQLTHHLILEMRYVINYDSFWDSESSDDVIKYEKSSSSTIF
jgi:hypothetical protein